MFGGGALALAFFKSYSMVEQLREPWAFIVHRSVMASMAPGSIALVEAISAFAYLLAAFYVWPSKVAVHGYFEFVHRQSFRLVFVDSNCFMI